jgi:hypothetical protein
MHKQYLIPADSIQDAGNALDHLPSGFKPGDEVVVLIVSEVPEGELVGSRPPVTVLDPLATTGGVSSEPRAVADQPEFIGREEIMEIRGRELCEAVQPRLAALHDRGYGARVDAVFSDDPDATILDYAGDLRADAVYVTPEFAAKLDEATRESASEL